MTYASRHGATRGIALGVGEKLMVKGLHAPKGYFRDWSAIDDSAQGIIEEIRVGGVA